MSTLIKKKKILSLIFLIGFSSIEFNSCYGTDGTNTPPKPNEGEILKKPENSTDHPHIDSHTPNNPIVPKSTYKRPTPLERKMLKEERQKKKQDQNTQTNIQIHLNTEPQQHNNEILSLVTTPHSSLISSTSIRETITELLRTAENRIIFVFDQFTDIELATELTNIKKRNVHIEILTGSNLSPQIEEEFTHNDMHYFPIQVSVRGYENTKMHNKFIVVDNYVLTGSPNATPNAFLKNIESFVVINNKDLADLFVEYANYIQSANPSFDNIREKGFSKKIKAFNGKYRDKIEVRLAPTTPIPQFISQEIRNVSNHGEIDINMFLVGDGLELQTIKTAFTKSSITLNIDKGQYEKERYIKKAINELITEWKKLKKNGQNPHPFKISLINGKNSEGFFHDKLILINNNGRKSVILGSAGFTRNVNDNRNYENMIHIKEEGVYDSFKQHVNQCATYGEILFNQS